ncbi:glycine-rich protein 5-like [Mizuhopecten yessoensis]|uniref:glycine-rich protein 5-like n=1 Tax=Mizuhopecten yessoensis TaxID=6573 RepID=UPI000B45718E|nr:glycine-rich protein 5-like [Mizuhopecten yessoensis]
MMQFLFTIACLVACVLCNTYRPPSYGATKDGGEVNTGIGDEGSRLSGRGFRRGSGFSGLVSGRRAGSVIDGVASGRRGGAIFDGVVSGRRGGAVFDGVVSGRRGVAVFDGVVSRQQEKAVFGGQIRGIGFDDSVSGRGVGSGIGGRFGGRGVGIRGNDDVVSGRWEQGRSRWSDRSDDRWMESRRRQQSNNGGVQTQPIGPAKLYN